MVPFTQETEFPGLSMLDLRCLIIAFLWGYPRPGQTQDQGSCDSERM